MLKSVVRDFGNEWKSFNQSQISSSDFESISEKYFRLINFNKLEDKSFAIDLGCGSGRWAKLVSKFFNSLICLDASLDALKVSKKNLSTNINCIYINASVENLPLKSNTFDFVYSLGVLHHVDDVEKTFEMASRILKKDKPFLVYLYYNLETKSRIYKNLWRISDYMRMFISRLPFPLKKLVTDTIALFVYLPIVKILKFISVLRPSIDLTNFPLNFYKNLSFYTMRTDALDRFGTKVEKRFSKAGIEKLFLDSGFGDVVFSSHAPFWCAIGYKKK